MTDDKWGDRLGSLLDETAEAIEPGDRLDASRSATSGDRRTGRGWWAAGSAGLVAASVVTINSPEIAFGTAGVNKMLIVQLASGATLLPQLLLCAKSPATAILAIFRATPPLLVSVTIWLGVAPPRMMLPKPIVVTERPNTGLGASVPLPLRLTALTVAAF